MKDIAIFGFKDSSTGQLINMLDDDITRWESELTEYVYS